MRVPEHAERFMASLSGGTALREDGFLFLTGPDWIMGIGYAQESSKTPNDSDPARFEAAFTTVASRFTQADCFAIAPCFSESWQKRVVERDLYYTLPASAQVPALLRGPVKKAAAGLRVDETQTFTAEHRRLWGEFLARTPLNARIRKLYASTESLLSTHQDLRLLNAWDAGGHLVACLVLDYELPDAISYIIGAHSKRHPAPHASDLLFAELLTRARASEKAQILLGLGVNEGITRFKRKWGGLPAQAYQLAVWREEGNALYMDDLLKAMLAAPADMSKRQIFAQLPRQEPFAMLWRLDKHGRTSWIGGAAHFFCCSFERSLRKLFENIDTVLFEGPLDPDSLDAVSRHGHSPDADAPRVLSFMTEHEVRALSRTVNGPFPRLARSLSPSLPPVVDVPTRLAETRPWFAFFSLWTAYLERHGWANSVDMDAWNLALDMGKAVLGMESLAEQIASLESAPLPRIVRFLQNHRSWRTLKNRNESAYLWGDMYNMMGTSAEFPTRTEAIIDVRDQRFRERMRPYIERGGTAVFVGSAHMLNLRRMLAEDGFTVTRVLPTWKHRLRAWWLKDPEIVLLPPHGAQVTLPESVSDKMVAPLTPARRTTASGTGLGSGESLSWLTAQARVPEHILPYVRAVSDVRLRECGGFAAWLSGGSLVLAGFDPYGEAGCDLMSEPTSDFRKRVNAAVELALAERDVERLTVLSTFRPDAAPANASVEHDSWWGLDLPPDGLFTLQHLPQKTRNMVSRGLSAVRILPESWTAEHAALVAHYLRVRPLPPGTRSLFLRLAAYAETSGALLLSARTLDNTLQAFTIGDVSALETVFYLFAFRKPSCPPGGADALFFSLACEASRRGHLRLNMGLGIDAGIGFFKRKWLAREWFPHVETTWSVQP